MLTNLPIPLINLVLNGLDTKFFQQWILLNYFEPKRNSLIDYCLLNEPKKTWIIKNIRDWHLLEKVKWKMLNKLIIDTNYKFLDLENFWFKLKNLQILKIDSSEIDYIPKELVNLRRLVCICPKISEIPSTFINLEYLNFYRTAVKEIPATLINLKCLDCSSKITFLPSTLINLTDLDCSNTKINYLPSTLIKLKNLNCHSCDQLCDIPKEYVNLTKLNIDFCSTSTTLKIHDTFTKLRILSCKHVFSFKDLPENLSDLEYLDISYTLISTLSNKYFKLKQLDCSHTEMTKIPESYTSLYYLNWNSNIHPFIIPEHIRNNLETENNFPMWIRV